jgi:hypothetical protein
MPEHVVQAVWLPANELILGDQPPRPTLPFSDDMLARMRSQAPWVIDTTPAGDSLPMTNMIEPSPAHRRSFVAPIGSLLASPRLSGDDPKVIWQDEYGNPYASISYKGNRGQHIDVTAGTSDPRGLRFNGLQTTYAIQRCMRASELLREAGVETEHITAVLLPSVIPHRNAVVSQSALKSELYMDKVFGNLERKLEEPDDPNQPKAFRLANPEQFERRFSDDELEALNQAFNESNFVVTERAMLTSNRLFDLMQNDKADITRQLDKAIRLHAILGNFETTADHNQDYRRYLGEFLPATLGKHIATIHNLGLAHRMLHTGNLTVTGGIVDLDSVVGPAIGLEERDNNVSDVDLLLDFAEYFYDHHGISTIKAIIDHVSKLLELPDANKTYHSFITTLYNSYTAHKNPEIVQALTDRERLFAFAAAYDPGTYSRFADGNLQPPQPIMRASLTADIAAFDRQANQDLNGARESQSATFNRIRSTMHSVRLFHSWLRKSPESPLASFFADFKDVLDAWEMPENRTNTPSSTIIRNAVATHYAATINKQTAPDTQKSYVGQQHDAAMDLYEARLQHYPDTDSDTEPALRIVGIPTFISSALPFQAALSHIAASHDGIVRVDVYQFIPDTKSAMYDHRSPSGLETAQYIYADGPRKHVTQILNRLRVSYFDAEISNVQVAERQRNLDIKSDGKPKLIGEIKAVPDFMEYAPFILKGLKNDAEAATSGYIAYVIEQENGDKILQVETTLDETDINSFYAASDLSKVPLNLRSVKETNPSEIFLNHASGKNHWEWA